MKIHKVKFNGFYTSEDEFETKFKDYGRAENESPRLDENTKRYVELIKGLDEKDLNIVDFGGGRGGHYLTIKNNTDKNIKCHIVETPQSFTKINNNVKYYSALEDVKEDDIDVVYSNGTIYITKGSTASENINKICKLNPKYILLQRTVLSEGGAYENFFTLSSQDYVGDGCTYYSITTDEHLKKICESYGYELVYDEQNRPEPTQFIVENAPNDIGTVCYKNYLFKRKDV